MCLHGVYKCVINVYLTILHGVISVCITRCNGSVYWWFYTVYFECVYTPICINTQCKITVPQCVYTWYGSKNGKYTVIHTGHRRYTIYTYHIHCVLCVIHIIWRNTHNMTSYYTVYTRKLGPRYPLFTLQCSLAQNAQKLLSFALKMHFVQKTVYVQHRVNKNLSGETSLT